MIELPFREHNGLNNGTRAESSRMAQRLELLFPRYESTTALTMGNKATALWNGTEAGIEGIDKFNLSPTSSAAPRPSKFRVGSTGTGPACANVHDERTLHKEVWREC